MSEIEQDEPIITIRLSLPNNLLSPNARINRHKKAALTKTARYATAVVCMAEMNGQAAWPLRHAVARETFTWPDKRRRDVRNAEASTKAVWDGVVDSGMIIDDVYWHLTHLPSRFQFDKRDPHLLIEIWEGEV